MQPFPTIALLALAAAGFVGSAAASPAPAVPAPPTGVLQVDRGAIYRVTHTGGALLENTAYKVQIARRVVPGAFVELHTHDTDVFHILEGSATFVAGGTPVDPQPSAPGEVRAKDIIGGTAYHLTKGDIIIIPHGIPHRFTEIVQGPLVYYVVKVVQ